MAKVILTVEDQGEGVNLEMVFDPPIGDGQAWEELTNAQQMAHNFYEALHAARPMTQEVFSDDLEPEPVALDLPEAREEDEFNGS